MIKKIINKIKNWFTFKTEVDPHEELYLHTPKPDIPIYKEEHCSGHLRFRKSCPRCQEIVA